MEPLDMVVGTRMVARACFSTIVHFRFTSGPFLFTATTCVSSLRFTMYAWLTLGQYCSSYCVRLVLYKSGFRHYADLLISTTTIMNNGLAETSRLLQSNRLSLPRTRRITFSETMLRLPPCSTRW
jgi:hypothetical protein